MFPTARIVYLLAFLVKHSLRSPVYVLSYALQLPDNVFECESPQWSKISVMDNVSANMGPVHTTRNNNYNHNLSHTVAVRSSKQAHVTKVSLMLDLRSRGVIHFN